MNIEYIKVYSPEYELFDKIEVETLKIFDFNILKCKIPKYFYDSKSLKESIDKTFMYDDWEPVFQQVGKAYSTSTYGGIKSVTNLNDVDALIDVISFTILKNFYKGNAITDKITFNRMWMNKMFKGCQGKCHSHFYGVDGGSAVFYYDVPTNGSKLIILKEKIDGVVEKKHDKIAHYIPVETGDLIIHHSSVFHAVSEHMSDSCRICFVFDFEKIQNSADLKFKYN